MIDSLRLCGVDVSWLTQLTQSPNHPPSLRQSGSFSQGSASQLSSGAPSERSVSSKRSSESHDTVIRIKRKKTHSLAEIVYEWKQDMISHFWLTKFVFPEGPQINEIRDHILRRYNVAGGCDVLYGDIDSKAKRDAYNATETDVSTTVQHRKGNVVASIKVSLKNWIQNMDTSGYLPIPMTALAKLRCLQMFYRLGNLKLICTKAIVRFLLGPFEIINGGATRLTFRLSPKAEDQS